MSLGKSVASIGGYTLISRIAGFVREILVAQILGAGPVSDAFFVAFKLPNFMRRIFAEGAFSASFVPLFSGALVSEGNVAAKRFAEDAQAVLSATLFALTSLMIVFMPYVLHAIAPGFGSNSGQFALAVDLARITFPYLLFISLVGLYGGVLNSLDRFTAYASAPILMNLCMIFGITVLADYSKTPAHGLAYGVFLAGVMQLLWLVYYAHKAGFLLRLRAPRLTPGVKKLLKNMLPVMLGASVAQINLVVDMIIATHIENAVSYLNYADRINELPLGVIGVALGTALLPVLSRHIRQGNDAEANTIMNRALEIGMVMCLPAGMALIVISEPVIHVLFERGAFTPEATKATAAALAAFSVGLPAFVLIKVFTPGFYARQDTKTPVKIAILCLVTNVALNLLLMGPFLHVGMAMATTISGWINTGLLAWVLYKRGHFIPDERLKKRLWRLIVSALVMTAALVGLQQALMPWLQGHGLISMVALGVLVGAGGGVFFVTALVIKAFSFSELHSLLKRKK